MKSFCCFLLCLRALLEQDIWIGGSLEVEQKNLLSVFKADPRWERSLAYFAEEFLEVVSPDFK